MFSFNYQNFSHLSQIRKNLCFKCFLSFLLFSLTTKLKWISFQFRVQSNESWKVRGRVTRKMYVNKLIKSYIIYFEDSLQYESLSLNTVHEFELSFWPASWRTFANAAYWAGAVCHLRAEATSYQGGLSSSFFQQNQRQWFHSSHWQSWNEEKKWQSETGCKLFRWAAWNVSRWRKYWLGRCARGFGRIISANHSQRVCRFDFIFENF